MSGHSPPASLLCLDARVEHFEAGDRSAHAALANGRELLEHARAQGWRVIHAFTPAPHAKVRGALSGFEPWRAEEVVALCGVAAFADSSLMAAARDRTRAPLHLAGALYGRVGLASLLGAQELGLWLALVTDACWRARGTAVAAEQVISLARSGPANQLRAARTSSVLGGHAENIIDLGAWRT